MRYELGVDLGTSYTAAAVRYDGRVEVAQLGTKRAEIPSLVFIKAGSEVLVGEAAERRGALDAASLAKEFKRRVGDRVPMQVGGQPFQAEALMGLLLDGVLATIARQQEGPPHRLSITCPANWGTYRRGLLEKAVRETAQVDVELHVEPEAAAIQFASGARTQPGEIVAVYDLGGGTFDAAVLQKTETGFALLGEPAGVEELGGVDFDEAVLGHVVAHLGPALADLDQDDPSVVEALVRLRRECVEAKEALSSDTDVSIPVTLPSMHTRIRLTRAELEEMIGPSLTATVQAMDRALGSAQVTPDSLRAVLLTGGSSRIPLVSELLTERYGRPLVMDPQPEHSIALGAARAAANGAAPPVPPEVTGQPPADRAAGSGAGGRGTTSRTGALGGALTGGWLRAGISALAVLLVIGTVWAVTRGEGEGQPDDQQPRAGGTATTAATAATEGWRRLDDLPVSLEAAAVTEFQNRLWVAGGVQDDADRTELTTVFIYDPETGKWSNGPSLPVGVSHGALAKKPPNGPLYFFGGLAFDGGVSTVWKLSANNATWEPDVPLPESRVGGVAAWAGSEFVYAGGTSPGNIASDVVWALRGARWKPLNRLSAPRHKPAVISNNVDSVWILGGRDPGPPVVRFGSIDKVFQGEVFPYAEATISPPVDAGVGVSLKGYGLCVLGGEVEDGYNDWWCENPAAKEELPKLDPPRAGLGGAWIDDTFYVVGGFNNTAEGGAFDGTNRLEAFTPEAE